MPRISAVVGRKPADCLDVNVPGPLGKAGKPHVFNHTLTQRGHRCSPFGLRSWLWGDLVALTVQDRSIEFVRLSTCIRATCLGTPG
jgi:hypothetical protein